MNIVSAYNARDPFEAEMLQTMLEDNGIPCYGQESGSGNYLRVAGNYNSFGTDIMVAEEDRALARQLIKETLDASKDLPEETSDDRDFDRAVKRKHRMIRIVIIVIAGIGLAVGIAATVTNFIG